MHNNPACILSIAGTDPSGGAGIQADIKAISATGGYAATVITALVAQNTLGVQAIEPVSAEFVGKQLDSVLTDLTINAVKIGMLHDERIIEVIARKLAEQKQPFVVCDPVMTAKDGSLLLDLQTLSLLKSQLLPQAYLITPNLFEAQQLFGKEIITPEEMEHAGRTMAHEFGCNVLIKGGHLAGENSLDILFDVQKGVFHHFPAQRIITKNTHGTGCSLSAAIASYLGQGLSLYAAVAQGKLYLTQAIDAGKNYSLGKGNGPIDHFYFLREREHPHAL